MQQFKKAKVIILPRDKAKSNYHQLWLNRIDKLGNATLVQNSKSNYICKFQELYIISNDVIKEGDCYYNYRLNEVFQAIRKTGYNTVDKEQKIIATTDTSLVLNPTHYSDGTKRAFHTIEYLAQPSQQFIEKYIESYNKGEIITNVLVEYEYCPNRTTKGDLSRCLKLNIKDNTITIKKIKNNWNRKEIIKLLNDSYNLGYNSKYSKIPDVGEMLELEKWIENNLL